MRNPPELSAAVCRHMKTGQESVGRCNMRYPPGTSAAVYRHTGSTDLKKIIQQFLKFGMVGVLCFFIDTGLYTVCNLMGVPYLISGVIGFSVSVIVNYLLSMKYVFVRRDDISRKKEFVIYLILSVIGLVLNELILFTCIDLVYKNWRALQAVLPVRAAELLAKIGATGIVMVYNFVTRKIFMEKKD